jgi:SAM-dependent methyltransferase
MEELTKGKKELDNWFSSDFQLHHLFPRPIQSLAQKHWTPLRIANLVAQFLVPHDGVKVLDIGSGVGKFCLAGGYYQPGASFFGVEQRKHLVEHAETARRILDLKNVHFFAMNLTELDFKQFDHFYFYNSFYENLFDTEKIDDSITCSPNLYNYYNRVLHKKLKEMPVGTRVAAYHCLESQGPSGYQLVEEHVGTWLKFWMKI